MKKIFCYFLIVHFLLTLGVFSKNIPNPIYPEKWDGKSTELPILQNKSKFKFEIKKNVDPPNSYSIAHEILIYRANEKDPFQILKPELTEGAPGGQSGLSVVDFDGDGDNDLRIVDWWGATGNIGYKVYLYDQNKDQFVYSKMYSETSRPEPDGTGCITSGGNGGHAGQIYSRGYYCPKSDNLVPVWEERQDWNNEEEFYIFTYRVWNEDRMIKDIIEHRKELDKNGDWIVKWSSESVWNEKTKCYHKTIKSQKDGELLEINKESKCL